MSDPLDPFAPIHVLLSLRTNPTLATASDEELSNTIQRLRGLASSQTLGASLSAESEAKVPRKKKAGVSAVTQGLLDSI